MTYEDDRRWADSHFAAAERIAISVLVDIKKITIRKSSESEDRTQATDGVLQTDRGDIGMRFRRETDFRDFTLRLSRPEGIKTEVEKVREGWPRWYLYGWTDRETIREWVFIDMDTFRKFVNLSDAALAPRVKRNRDETEFVFWTLEEIRPAILKKGSVPLPVFHGDEKKRAREIFARLNDLTIKDPRGAWEVPEHEKKIAEMLVTQGFLRRIDHTATRGYYVVETRCLLPEDQCVDWRGLPVRNHPEYHLKGFPF